MNAIYRKCKETDVSSLVELLAQLGYEHSEKSIIENINSVRSAGGEIFVSELSGSVCGCVSAILDARLAAGVSGEIVSLVVNELYRGKGIGRGLVTFAESWLKERTPKIRVRANVVREDAHLFYKKLGYTLSKTQTVFKKNV